MLFEKQMIRMYRNNLFSRNGNRDGIFYFQETDFPGLTARPYTFPAGAGHDLKGYFYSYPNPNPDRLVVFDHGMGNGHRAYMVEIERLCRAGYLVFSYDHTGCMESGGENTGGFAQSLNDLDNCLRALKAEETLRDRKISVVGHSWGGFSTMNIAALHPEITHVVSMSGFVSVEIMLEQLMQGPLKGMRKPLLALERQVNPDYVDFDARKSLANTDAKVLLIYSDDDKTVRADVHFLRLKDALAHRPNVRFLLVSGKDHNPGYTVDAVQYKNTFFREFTKAKKRGQLKTAAQQKEFMARYDFVRMTAQDETVWAEILNHLES